MSISVVVPVYNAEQSLRTLVAAIVEVLGDQDIEIILVDDGSRDESWKVIVELARDYMAVRGILLMRNYGQHNATLCGIRAAKNDVVVTMDDDLQNPPAEIPRMLEQLTHFDVVYGSPKKEAHGILRNVASRITKWALQSAMGAETANKVSAFRAFRTELRAGFAGYESPYVSIDVLLTWSTQRFTSIAVRNDPRELGVSNYTVWKLIAHALNMMTGFSVLPLQLASITGFAFTGFGFAVLVFVLIRFLIHGDAVPGFPFLASIIAIFSGAQLFALGIIGEYLARMHFRTMDKPTYVKRVDTGAYAAVAAQQD